MRRTFCVCIAALAAHALCAQDVVTGGYDIGRTNADLNETALTPATVNPAQFGKLFTLPVDGQIFAQPLYCQNIAIAGQGVHNIVFVATANNTVYAFDADTAGPPLWEVNLGPSVPSSTYDQPTYNYTDIAPEIGIIGTPVIDSSTGTLYVVAATVENGTYYHRLHALDTSSGNEKFGGPAVIAAQMAGDAVDSVNGTVSFNSLQELQRPALLLLNGVVYVAFGSHGDIGAWHGWLMGYSAANVQRQLAVYNSTPNGIGGAIWQSGRGPAADSQGNIYVSTGNGDTDEVTAFSESVLRLNPGDLTVADWFIPADNQILNGMDQDLGSGGAVLVPGTNLLLAGGKQGLAYLLNTGNLGEISLNDSQAVQSFPVANVGVYNMAVWNRSTGPVLYLTGGNAPLTAYAFSGNQFATTPSSETTSGYAVAYNGITVSANGSTPGSGIVWASIADSWPLPATGTLHAFNADDLSIELWNSDMNPGRDALGTFARFTNPTVANGKVYAPTDSDALAVYGELPPDPASPPQITAVVNAASYAGNGVVPGEIVDIFGTSLGPQTLVTGAWNSSGNLSTNLAGMQVTFNGVAAPLVYVSSYVMSAIVPYEISSASQASVQVSSGGLLSTPQTFPILPSAPGIFTGQSSGSGQAAILNQDSSINADSNPAAPGSIVSIYATGGGQTSPPQSTGVLAPGAASLNAAVTATIGGQPATVLYAGQAPGEVAGVMQVNVQIPASTPTGDIPIAITAGGASSQLTTTLAVQ